MYLGSSEVISTVNGLYLGASGVYLAPEVNFSIVPEE